MSAVGMREQLLIQQNTASTVRGAPSPATWGTLDTVAAEHLPLTGTEQLEASRVGSQVKHRFRVRSRADITAAMRALWTPSWLSSGSRKILQIAALVPDPRNRSFMFVDCSEDDAGGTA